MASDFNKRFAHLYWNIRHEEVLQGSLDDFKRFESYFGKYPGRIA